MFQRMASTLKVLLTEVPESKKCKVKHWWNNYVYASFIPVTVQHHRSGICNRKHILFSRKKWIRCDFRSVSEKKKLWIAALIVEIRKSKEYSLPEENNKVRYWFNNELRNEEKSRGSLQSKMKGKENNYYELQEIDRKVCITPSLPSSKSTFSQSFKEKCISENGSTLYNHLSSE